MGSMGDNNWIMDMSCSFHMNLNKKFYLNFKEVDGHNVIMRNNETCKVVGIGNIQIKMFNGVVITLYKVCHSPNLKMSLISICIHDENGYIYKVKV